MIIDGFFLDNLLIKARTNPRLRSAYDLRDSAQDGSQRLLNALIPGTEVPIHRHSGTSETVFILRGEVEEVLYDESGQEVERCLLSVESGRYGMQVPKGVWHTVKVLKESVIVEMKEGRFEETMEEDVCGGGMR